MTVGPSGVEGDAPDRYAWVTALERGAPDIVAAWRSIEEGDEESARRAVREHAGPGTAEALAGQLAVLADALSAVVADLTDSELQLDGGEGGWTVAQAVGHACDARAGLCLAAAKAAAGSWPDDAPSVVQGIAGPADADRATLIRRIGVSQRIVERSARTVAGHETEPCPLDHPTVGRLRCGEWLAFAGVHDLLHLDQLHGITGR